MLEDQSSGSLGLVWENKCFVGAGSDSKQDWLSLHSLGQWLSRCLACGKAGNGMSCAKEVEEDKMG